MQKTVDYTSKIISRLPYWFAMKKKPSESIGKAFLRAVGLEFDEMVNTLDYMYEQIEFDKTDITMMSDCYKAILPESFTLPISSFVGDGETVYELENIKDFMNFNIDPITHKTLENLNAYYLDEGRKVLYSRKNYEVSLIVDNSLTEFAPNFYINPVWNYFDEFGLLLGTPRNPGESNLSYKNRLRDVFRNPSSSAYQGLVNGLARELGCRVEMIIDDSSKDIELQEKMIVPTHMNSNQVSVPEDRLVKNTEGKYVILGDTDGDEKELSYVHSIEVHQMNEYRGQDDIGLENELFYTNGLATPKLREYAKMINELCPIMWNFARWDESHWIKDMSYFGYVPNLCDASIEGFRETIDMEPTVDTFVVGKAIIS